MIENQRLWAETFLNQFLHVQRVGFCGFSGGDVADCKWLSAPCLTLPLWARRRKYGSRQQPQRPSSRAGVCFVSTLRGYSQQMAAQHGAHCGRKVPKKKKSKEKIRTIHDIWYTSEIIQTWTQTFDCKSRGSRNARFDRESTLEW